jgi:hypothetical protein
MSKLEDMDRELVAFSFQETIRSLESQLTNALIQKAIVSDAILKLPAEEVEARETELLSADKTIEWVKLQINAAKQRALKFIE